MIGQNAIIAMCAIVITIYTLRSNEAHYLPDIIGLALALAAPRQSMALGAWLLVVLVRHTPVGYGLAAGMPSWLLVIALPRAAAHMSIAAEESSALESAYKERITEDDSRARNSEIPQPVAEIPIEKVHLIESELLAKLIIAGEIELTKAVQIGAGAKSGKKYTRRSNLVKQAMERQRNHYPASSTHKRYE